MEHLLCRTLFEIPIAVPVAHERLAVGKVLDRLDPQQGTQDKLATIQQETDTGTLENIERGHGEAATAIRTERGPEGGREAGLAVQLQEPGEAETDAIDVGVFGKAMMGGIDVAAAVGIQRLCLSRLRVHQVIDPFALQTVGLSDDSVFCFVIFVIEDLSIALLADIVVKAGR